MAEPLTPERLAWIRDHAQRQYTIESDEADELLAEIDRLRVQTHALAVLVDELAVERGRLWAQVATAWDEGEAAGRDNADDGYPDPLVENPYRAARASDG